MVVRKRKKIHKYRGERHARRGYNDRNRNAGIRGGRGRAGMGKMKDHKVPIHIPEKGFYNPTHREIKAISVRTIVRNLENWKEKGLVEEKDGKVLVDIEKLGYDKLIGRVPEGVRLENVAIKAPLVAETTKESLEKAGVEIIAE